MNSLLPPWLVAIACIVLTSMATQSGTARAADSLTPRLAAIERRLDARLGVAVVDTGSGHQWAYRGHERFPMMSTFKPLLCALLLSRVDRGQDTLARRLPITTGDLLDYAPVTEKHVGPAGMSTGDLCEATITLSDNTAANLLLKQVGGPAGVTAFVRAQGDGVTRLDRDEPTLNEAKPGDPRDTTTPVAMTGLLRTLVLGDVLSGTSRRQLTDWLLANKTGDAKIRAGLPTGWRVGDKTGSGANGSMNDVAVIWPPMRPPVLLAIYITGTQASTEARNAAMADIARAVADTLPH